MQIPQRPCGNLRDSCWFSGVQRSQARARHSPCRAAIMWHCTLTHRTTHTYLHTRMHTPAYTHVCAYAHTHARACQQTHTHTHTLARARKHTCTHIVKQEIKPWLNDFYRFFTHLQGPARPDERQVFAGNPHLFFNLCTMGRETKGASSEGRCC
jgi:hypothetical protein